MGRVLSTNGQMTLTPLCRVRSYLPSRSTMTAWAWRTVRTPSAAITMTITASTTTIASNMIATSSALLARRDAQPIAADGDDAHRGSDRYGGWTVRDRGPFLAAHLHLPSEGGDLRRHECLLIEEGVHVGPDRT